MVMNIDRWIGLAIALVVAFGLFAYSRWGGDEEPTKKTEVTEATELKEIKDKLGEVIAELEKLRVKCEEEPAEKKEASVDSARPTESSLPVSADFYFNGKCATGSPARIAAIGDARAEMTRAKALQDAVGLSPAEARAANAKAELDVAKEDVKRLTKAINDAQEQKEDLSAEFATMRAAKKHPWMFPEINPEDVKLFFERWERIAEALRTKLDALDKATEAMRSAEETFKNLAKKVSSVNP